MRFLDHALRAGAVALTIALGSAQATQAAETLRVCASTKEAPYSVKDGTGFENRIAQVLADAMGRKLEHVWIDREAIYLVRDGIDAGLCEVVMGVDAADPRLLTTEPYYRTGYAFISRQDRNFEGTRWEDADTPGFARFSYRFHSPAETILQYTGKYENNLAYVNSLINFKSRRNQYINVAADMVVDEVVAGNADLAIAFAPDVARYVKASGTPLKLTLITNDIVRSDGKVIPLNYAQAIGVAKSAPDLVAPIEAALRQSADAIRAILESEGVPLLPLGS